MKKEWEGNWFMTENGVWHPGIDLGVTAIIQGGEIVGIISNKGLPFIFKGKRAKRRGE